MAYFNELPNLQVVSRFPNQSSNQDYTTIKNLWKRAKLREDIANAITAFNYYQIEGDERPDQIAQKIYGDPELDWVILITNNITNVNEEWPLEDETFYKYLIDKYGSEEALQEVHHTETINVRDEFNRLVIPEGLQVDSSSNIPSSFNTTTTEDNYKLDAFPSADGLTSVKVNLIQALKVNQIVEGDVFYLIPDIKIETSTLKVYKRDSDIMNVTINNNLIDNWPSSWGGNLQVYARDGIKNIIIDDILSSTVSINIPDRLYEVIGELVGNNIVPVFKFRYIAQG
jgi:hypothetical protein